jgi:hypothetical protein
MFDVADREDSAARRARLFHLAGTIQTPSAFTDTNGNQTTRITATTAQRNRSRDARSRAATSRTGRVTA